MKKKLKEVKKDKQKIKRAAKLLREMSLNAGYSEKLLAKFEENDAYKVCYRFIGNAVQSWNDIGLGSFPTEEEVIELAKLADPYFVWLFNDADELANFKATYDFHQDVWSEYDPISKEWKKT